MELGQGRADRVLGEPCTLEQGVWAAPSPRTHLVAEVTWRRPISYPWES